MKPAVPEEKLLSQFQLAGSDLFLSGLVSTHAGNLSVRRGLDRLVITRRGSMLAHLNPPDLVETGLWGDDEASPRASSELVVHRAILQGTDAGAVVHAHPPHAIALSLTAEEIVPVDAEGLYLLGRVPVLDAENSFGSLEVARRLPEILRRHRVAMVRGHGSFAVGETLEEGLHWTSTLEASARVLCILRPPSARR